MPRTLALQFLLVLIVVCFCTLAWGASVQVSPVRVHLSESKRSELLRVTNQGTEPARLQITAYVWSQKANGEMVLKPTSDLVFFPSLFDIAAGKARRIRVGTQLSAGAKERAFRIVIEQLPPPVSPQGFVRVLTRLNLPVFFQVGSPRSQPVVKARVEGRELAVVLANRGSSYFKSTSVRILARDGKGGVVLEEDLPAWYVLAGGRRTYRVRLPEGRCEEIDSVVVVVRTEDGSVSSSLDRLPAKACSG